MSTTSSPLPVRVPEPAHLRAEVNGFRVTVHRKPLASILKAAVS